MSDIEKQADNFMANIKNLVAEVEAPPTIDIDGVISDEEKQIIQNGLGSLNKKLNSGKEE